MLGGKDEQPGQLVRMIPDPEAGLVTSGIGATEGVPAVGEVCARAAEGSIAKASPARTIPLTSDCRSDPLNVKGFIQIPPTALTRISCINGLFGTVGLSFGFSDRQNTVKFHRTFTFRKH